MINLSDQSYAMPVCRDIPVTVNVEKLLRYEGNTDHGMIVETATWAAETAVKLSKPAIAYRYLPAEIAGKQLNVCGVYLQIGPLIHLLKKAREVAVGLVTVGSEIEEAVRQLQASNDLLESYLLNCATFEALDNVALYLKAMIEDKAGRKKWGVSPALSPGALPGWPTVDQHNLCSLLDLSQVGVKITDSALLLPRYSLSLLVGMGPAYAKTRVAATCGYCSLKKSCSYRHQDESAAEQAK
jgi:hypothetical protein